MSDFDSDVFIGNDQTVELYAPKTIRLTTHKIFVGPPPPSSDPVSAPPAYPLAATDIVPGGLHLETGPISPAAPTEGTIFKELEGVGDTFDLIHELDLIRRALVNINKRLKFHGF